VIPFKYSVPSRYFCQGSRLWYVVHRNLSGNNTVE